MEDPMIGTIEDALKRYLGEQLLIDFVGEIDENTDLFQMGLMDSYNYIESIRFIELEFNVRFTNEEILTDVVTSLSGLTALVSNKIAMQV